MDADKIQPITPAISGAAAARHRRSGEEMLVGNPGFLPTAYRTVKLARSVTPPACQRLLSGHGASTALTVSCTVWLVRDVGPPAFVVVGEALIDLSPPAEDGSCIARPGGSPMNVALGLARLGQPTAFAGRLSADPFGSVLRRHLERSAVSLQHAVAAADPSTIALVELDSGQARYQFSLGADFQWQAAELAFLPAGAQAVHFGSLASWLPPGDVAVAVAIDGIRRAASALISYDPNVRPALQPDRGAARRQVEQSVSLAHIVKASTDDVAWLYGPDSAEAVARRWLALGARVVVITAGADGATGWTPERPPVSRPRFGVRVVDTVGAGDAFTSGLLDALARRDLLAAARLAALDDAAILGGVLDDACLIAGVTCSRAGANPPTRAELGRR
jgi:fructokinase